MINEWIPDDILKILINIHCSVVCKHWYELWVKKQTKLTVCIPHNITKSSINSLLKLNIVDMDFNNSYYNDDLKKFTNITSLSVAHNKAITNSTLKYFPNLTDLKLDYYDNLVDNESFDFCTNIKKLSVTFSKVMEPSEYKLSWIKLKNVDENNFRLELFSNLTDLHIDFHDYGSYPILNGLRKLTNLTNLQITRPPSNNYNHQSGLSNLTSLFSLNNPDGFTIQERADMLQRTLPGILSQYEYTGPIGD